ncbi:MAG: hypothetical protein ABUS47_02320 [Steroidobacter sp.]
MSHSKSSTWISDGEKYASICLEVKLDNNFSSIEFSLDRWALSEVSFEIPVHWKEWLGSIHSEELKASNFFLLSKLRSSTVGVLDDENQILQKRVWNFYVGLLLCSNFSPANEPVLITGSCQDGAIGIRQHQSLDSPVSTIIHLYPTIHVTDITSGALLGENLERIGSAPISGGYWRLCSILRIYVEARATPSIIDRIHQYCRCIDGLILPEVGKTQKQFKSRTEIFIGSNHHRLMGEVYDVRSAVEHLHENLYLENFDRATRLELARKEAIIEYIARTSIARIISNEKLWSHFSNADALKVFWDLPFDERKKIWGDPVDPLLALSDFNPQLVSDGELGS